MAICTYLTLIQIQSHGAPFIYTPSYVGRSLCQINIPKYPLAWFCGDVSFVEENISKWRLVRVAARQHMGQYAKRIWIIDQRAVEVILNFIPSSVLGVGWFDECASAVSRKVNIAQTMRAKKTKPKTTHLSTNFITTHKSQNPTPLPSLLRIFDSPLPTRLFLSVARLPVKTAEIQVNSTPSPLP